jgi:DNA polymerase III gamma/tau subunit
VLNHFQTLLLYKIGYPIGAMVTAGTETNYAKLAERFSIKQLNFWVKAFLKLKNEMRWQISQKTLLEVTLLDLMNTETIPVASVAPEKIISKAPVKPEVKTDIKPETKASLSPPEVRPEIKSDVTVQSGEISLSKILHQWESVLQMTKQKRVQTYMSLAEAKPTRYADGKLTLTLKSSLSFHQKKLSEASHQTLIAEILRGLFNSPFNIEFVLDGPAPTAAASPNVSNNVLSVFGGKVL